MLYQDPQCDSWTIRHAFLAAGNDGPEGESVVNFSFQLVRDVCSDSTKATTVRINGTRLPMGWWATCFSFLCTLMSIRENQGVRHPNLSHKSIRLCECHAVYKGSTRPSTNLCKIQDRVIILALKRRWTASTPI
jgi:hypothetical protein